MYYPPVDEIKAHKRNRCKFPVGYYTYTPDNSNMNYFDDFSIDLEDTVRILIIAPTGTGKTFLLRRLVDEFNNCGVRNIILNDIKGEMHSSAQPNSQMVQQMKKELVSPQLANEISEESLRSIGLVPTAIENIIFYAPEFGYNRNHPYYNEVKPFSLKFSDFNEVQARTILEIKDNAYNQRRVLNYMLELSRESANEGEDTLTQERIYEFRDKILRLIEQRGSMISRDERMVSPEFVSVFDRLVDCINRNIIDGDYAVDMGKFIGELEYNNLVFDWSGLTRQDFNDAKSEYTLYLSSIVYNLSEAKRDGEIKAPICFVADEMQDFLYNTNNNSIQDALRDVFTKGRAYNINAIVALHSGKYIDNVFQHNANYIFFGKLSTRKKIKNLKITFSDIFERLEHEEEIARILQGLNRCEFLAINVESMKYGVIVAYPPLSQP